MATTRGPGEEIWRVVERGSHSGSTRPVAGHGLVFVPMGFDAAQLLAIRPDGKGDVAASHVAWRFGKGAPSKPSILLVGDLIFMVNDGGIVGAARSEDRRDGLARPHRRHLLRVAHCGRRAHLRLQRGW